MMQAQARRRRGVGGMMQRNLGRILEGGGCGDGHRLRGYGQRRRCGGGGGGRRGVSSSPSASESGALTAHAAAFLVLVEVALEGEALVASLADEGLLGRVGLHVRAQVGLVGKGFGADVAFERLLSRVRANVSLKEPRTRESLAAAVRAFASLGMRLDVHRKGRDGDVDFVAVWAFPGVSFVGGSAVNLAMARQVGGRGILFAAFGARKAALGARRRQAEGSLEVVALFDLDRVFGR